MSVVEKFLRLVQVDSPSNPERSNIMPSSECEYNFALMVKSELKRVGVRGSKLDENGYIYATIPANCECEKSIGFIAHLDTVCEPNATNIEPIIHENYDGGDIVLNGGTVISPSEFPEMRNYIGQDIITSNGTTILGADDKAGLAEILEVCEYLNNHPEFKHGKIGIAFTPDEEIGNGASKFDVERFGCDYAYTVDGEEIGEISYETFNGAAFKITVRGKGIHPGSAKGKMVNSILIAQKIISAFPNERPENTERREGFYFISHVKGNVEKTEILGIIRDHDRAIFESRKAFLKSFVETFQDKYPGRIDIDIHDEYYNCAAKILPHFHLVENAKAAMVEIGVKPKIFAIRGGTDGSGLSYKGLPCPNICTGGHNAHGLQEFVPAQSMEKVVKIILGIISKYAK